MFAASLIVLALAGSTLAAPAATPAKGFAPPSACKSIGKAVLGYDPTDIPIYSSAAPKRYLGEYGNIDGSGAKLLQPGNTVPQEFEVYSCKDTPSPSPGKGAISAQDGFIVSSTTPGNCLTASDQKKFGAHFVSKPCDFTSGYIANSQHFQFLADTFFSYKLVDFLGDTKGPTQNATKSFSTGQAGYHYRIDTDDTPYGSETVALDYQPGSYISTADTIIASFNYKAPAATFPECRLRKNGALA
ncbi:hypothetical protein IE81DRAFT_325255 [Ceraceosorus guamensis]|uniref:Uncharacterized protein n=1 Tax=Ceraceosorus guamensis TaxID=1522189 RepID=A0A316VT09_9BASI|nr:hypothetical protein IE81DRAFT_325255 [Ceraceosorus guamensis]PWN40726.1 hypothetical protein IE81DRAFT_325255 [Ceraceosorus guamensis]